MGGESAALLRALIRRESVEARCLLEEGFVWEAVGDSGHNMVGFSAAVLTAFLCPTYCFPSSPVPMPALHDSCREGKDPRDNDEDRRVPSCACSVSFMTKPSDLCSDLGHLEVLSFLPPNKLALKGIGVVCTRSKQSCAASVSARSDCCRNKRGPRGKGILSAFKIGFGVMERFAHASTESRCDESDQYSKAGSPSPLQAVRAINDVNGVRLFSLNSA